MGFFTRMVSQESRTVIYRNVVRKDRHWAQQMVLQISYFNHLVDHDVICPPRVGIIIQQGSADGVIGLCK